MQQTQYDCCVIGGGMVGGAIALGLAKQSFKVALVEKDALAPFSIHQPPDIRLSALNMHAVSLLSSLGAWQHIQKMRLRAYDTMSVWDAQRDDLGILASTLSSRDNISKPTVFTAKEVGQPLLGYFVENRLIQLALYNEISANYSNYVDCIHERQISSIDVEQGVVTFSNEHSIQASLIIGADGANSKVRQAARIATSGWQYSQQANAILIETANKVPAETWQAFYKSGPRALLPMYDNYACLVWYDSAAKSKQIKHASKAQLKAEVELNFPQLRDAFDIIEVAGFGLTRMHAHTYGKGKAVLAGDSAHTINPLAGQGVNLGFQDVSALLEIIGKYGLNDCGKLISKYEQKRKVSNLLMMSAMDVIYKSFSSSFLPTALARNLALSLANKAGPLKRKTLKYAMGLDK